MNNLYMNTMVYKITKTPLHDQQQGYSDRTIRKQHNYKNRKLNSQFQNGLIRFCTVSRRLQVSDSKCLSKWAHMSYMKQIKSTINNMNSLI